MVGKHVRDAEAVLQDFGSFGRGGKREGRGKERECCEGSVERLHGRVSPDLESDPEYESTSGDLSGGRTAFVRVPRTRQRRR